MKKLEAIKAKALNSYLGGSVQGPLIITIEGLTP